MSPSHGRCRRRELCFAVEDSQAVLDEVYTNLLCMILTRTLQPIVRPAGWDIETMTEARRELSKVIYMSTSLNPTTVPGTVGVPSTTVEVKLEGERIQKTVAVAFEELIETIINVIQEPEVTEVGVSTVMARLQAYSARMTSLLDGLPSQASNGSDGLNLGGR